MSIFLENSVYLVYLISLLMRHVPRRKKWHVKHCSIFRNTMIHTSGCLSLCRNVLPEMALFVVSAFVLLHSFSKEISMTISFTQILIWIIIAAVVGVVGELIARRRASCPALLCTLLSAWWPR